MHSLTTNKKKALKTARQALGILQKVEDMVEADAYCPEVIQQVDAVTGLLTSMKKELLIGHLQHCLDHRLKNDRSQTVRELMRIYDLSSTS